LDATLRVNELSKSFGSKKVVDGISFEVNQGDILGLLGPNGAGKTTAIRMIMGILSPGSGEINFNFNGKTSSMDKSRIGYLPEERGLYDDARVLDTLIYLAVLKGTPRKEAIRQAMEWLDKFQLASYAQHKLEKLSKGMQQKVQFIATVLHQPEVVMLDEPFSGLDPLNQELFKQFIRELQQKGCTILLSAHQMNLVEELCEKIFMINQGKQVLYGSLTEIKSRHPEHLVTLVFPEAEDSSFLKHEPGVSILKQDIKEITLRYTGANNINELLQKLASRVSLEEITVQKPPLHDIFVQTVKNRGETIEDASYIQRA